MHDYYIPRSIDYDKLINIMNRELSKAEFLLKSNTSSVKSESSSLKIKLKLNPKDLASSTSTLICETPTPKPKVKKEKEVLTFKPSANITEVSFSDVPPTDQDKPPIKLVMKIPKLFESEVPPLPQPVASQVESVKPIKLKIKTQDMVTVVASSIPQAVEESESSPKSEDNSESEAEIRNEDDEFMHEIKNSYQDDEFFYTSVKIRGTTARTSKKAKLEHAQGSGEPGEEKKSKKRKLKDTEAKANAPETPEVSKSGSQEETLGNKPEKPEVDTNNSQDSRTVDSDEDQEYKIEDEVNNC